MVKREWEYNLNLLKDVSTVFMVWKIFALSSFFPVFILLACEIFDGTLSLETLGEIGKIYLLILGIMSALLLVSYYLFFIPVYGIKYSIIFKMDEEGINHIVGKRQKQKAKILSVIGMFLGIIARNPTVAGTSMISGSRSSMYTKFKNIKKIIVYRKQHRMKLISKDFTRNIIYTSSEDFDEISEYILKQSNEEAERIMK